MGETQEPTSESTEIGDAKADGRTFSRPESDDARDFDFDAHRQQAVEAYQGVRQQYQDCAEAAESVLKAALEAANTRVHTLESRAKDPESFARKASLPSEEDPAQPKYTDPLRQITDLAAVRVITFLLDEVEKVNAQVEEQFHVLEKVNKSGLLVEEEKLGYHSVHYLVGFTPQRLSMPEYARHRDLVIEIQVRTILQHAWAEIEHDIQYKAIETIPTVIRRRFVALAGLLEIADREFQAVSDEDQRVRIAALRHVELGDLAAVEVTQEALKAYLDRKLGADGRMTAFSYEWEARILRRLGFSNLQELDDAIARYDDDRISRLLHGNRQGQLTRLEDVLLASLGEEFIDRHPWTHGDYGQFWRELLTTRLQRLRENGIAGRRDEPNHAEDEEVARTDGDAPAA
jgi:ppGpp synthetase/RelA/SpoT-type nucleotidyltranferase